MRTALFIASAVYIGSVVADQCLPNKGDPHQITCFDDRWPKDLICPNHPFHGHPHDYISGQQLKEFLADVEHPPTKCTALKENQKKATCQHTVQFNDQLPSPDKGYTFIWTTQSLKLDGTSVFEFGGMYWRRVSILVPRNILMLTCSRIQLIRTVRQCGASDVTMTRQSVPSIHKNTDRFISSQPQRRLRFHHLSRLIPRIPTVEV